MSELIEKIKKNREHICGKEMWDAPVLWEIIEDIVEVLALIIRALGASVPPEEEK